MARFSLMRLLILISLVSGLSLSACGSATGPVRPTALPEAPASPSPVGRPIIREQDHLDHLAQQAEGGDTQAARQLERYRRAESKSQAAAALEQNARAVSPEVTRHLAALKCTAQRLGHSIWLTGTKQPWPVLESFPEHLAHSVGEPILVSGESKSGYEQTVYIDMVANTAYLVEIDPDGERSTIYGPLPVVQCPELRPNSSFKPKPLRSTNHMAGTACHVLGSTTQLGLT